MISLILNYELGGMNYEGVFIAFCFEDRRKELRKAKAFLVHKTRVMIYWHRRKKRTLTIFAHVMIDFLGKPKLFLI